MATLRTITAGGHYSAYKEYLIFHPPPSYYQHPRPSSDARRSSAAGVVGARTVHFHSGGEREHFQLDRRFVCGHGRRHNPPSASAYLRLHNRRRWAVWTAEMWVYIINSCVLMSKIKNNVISHPLPPPSLRLQSPMLQLPPFSPDNRSISLKKRPQRLEGKKVSRFG